MVFRILPSSPRWRIATVLATVAVAGCALCANAARAAEIKLRDQSVCRHTRVQLGDVAEIRATDDAVVEDLARIDLCSAPRSGQPRTIDIREIRELLALYGFEISQMRFEGERQVVVYAHDDAQQIRAPLSENQANSDDAAAHDQARTEVAGALRQYLCAQQAAYWEVEAELSRGDVELLATGATITRVAGGQAPWTGKQRFELQVQTSRGATSLAMNAFVKRKQTVVTASRNVERGSLISSADVILQPADDNQTAQDDFIGLDDVIGLEATRPITAGQVFKSQMVQRPILVERGKIVTVVAIASGVKVTSEARALDEGARGDLIRMQPLEGNDKYTARVVDYGRVEVYAHGPTVQPSPAPRYETRQTTRSPARHDIRRVIETQ